MGSPEDDAQGFDDQRPRHRVEVRSGFRIAAVPVTRAQYAVFDPEHRSYGFEDVPAEELDHHPVNQVTWYAAVAFCRWLSQALPQTAGARLPTEAEWEYGCRAGSDEAFWSGDGEEDLDRVGWCEGNEDKRTHRVGEKSANPWGLYDVHGNVWEWTLSPWSDDYSERRDGGVEDPQAVSVDELIGDDPGGGRRVSRGGSYAVTALLARSAYRVRFSPGDDWGSQGFRVALPAAPSDGS
jgi:formylglycine-generating enzyme required for sulfatase activity